MGWFCFLWTILFAAAGSVSCQELTLLPQDDDACMRNEVTFNCTIRGSQTLRDLVLAWSSPEYIGLGDPLRVTIQDMPGANVTSMVNGNVTAILTSNTMIDGVPVLVSELHIIGADLSSVIMCSSETNVTSTTIMFDSSAFPGRPQRGEAIERSAGGCDFLVTWSPPTNIDISDIGSYRVYVPSRSIMKVSLSNMIDLNLTNCRDGNNSIQVAAVNRFGCVGPNSTSILLTLLEIPSSNRLSSGAVAGIAIVTVAFIIIVIILIIFFGYRKVKQEQRRIELQNEKERHRIELQNEEERRRIERQNEEERHRIERQNEEERHRIERQNEEERHRIERQNEEERHRIERQNEEERRRIQRQNEEERRQNEKDKFKESLKTLIQAIRAMYEYTSNSGTPSVPGVARDLLKLMMKMPPSDIKEVLMTVLDTKVTSANSIKAVLLHSLISPVISSFNTQLKRAGSSITMDLLTEGSNHKQVGASITMESLMDPRDYMYQKIQCSVPSPERQKYRDELIQQVDKATPKTVKDNLQILFEALSPQGRDTGVTGAASSSSTRF